MRRITRRQLLLSSLGLAALPYPYARWYERHYPVVETVQTPVPHLPSALEGLRVVQLSDLHLSTLNGPDLMHRVVQQVQSLKPDLLLLTGDFVTDHERDAAPLAEILAALQPPLGSYASLGNHDYWTDAHTVTQSLRHKGIQVLIDQVVPLQHRGETLHLGGMDSAWGGRPDFSAVSHHLPRRR